MERFDVFVVGAPYGPDEVVEAGDMARCLRWVQRELLPGQRALIKDQDDELVRMLECGPDGTVDLEP